MMRIALWIEGQPPRKSNQRVFRLVHSKSGKGLKCQRCGNVLGLPTFTKSDQALAWTDDALKQTTGDKKLQLGSPDSPVAITAYVFYKNRRPDLSIELILDALEKAEVIANDRHVYEQHAHKFFCRHRQGVLLVIEEIPPDRPLKNLLAEVAFGYLGQFKDLLNDLVGDKASA